jgi:putative ABC transport system permease protein
MLKLTDIKKDYILEKAEPVHALKGISASFGNSGFVAVLGPSGCGKTTLLNIIGGLDRYTFGDLEVDGKSTVKFDDKDWDNYRNKKIGMVFQTYNLISHMSVLDNVEVALTLSGVERSARRSIATDALIAVGLESEINKMPNQMSGGQMQRVAIARAIVNNPSIILADEPTGALDSKTSVQIMDILAKIAKERLVIMVTHNRQLAVDYSDRIIEMKDGLIISDSPNAPKVRPVDVEKKEEDKATAEDYTVIDESFSKNVASELKKAKVKKKKSSMSFFTALSISWKNLKTKKGRTIMTSVAGSFGIIGVALVLSLSNGFSNYISSMQSETLASFPVSIEEEYLDTSSIKRKSSADAYPKDHDIVVNKSGASLHINVISDDYINYVNDMDDSYTSSINFNHALRSNVLTLKDGSVSGGSVISISTDSTSLIESYYSSSYWHELPSNDDFVKSKYDVVEGKYPENSDEVCIVVDKFNSMSDSTLSALGYDSSVDKISVADVLAKVFKLVPNNNYYTKSDTPTTITGRYLLSKEELAAKGLVLNKLSEYLAEAMTCYTKKDYVNAKAYIDKVGEFFASSLTDKDLYSFTVPSNDGKKTLFNDDTVGTKIKVVGILRPSDTSVTSLLNSGIYYRHSLVEQEIQENQTSEIANDYINHMVINPTTTYGQMNLPTVYSVNGSVTPLTSSTYLPDIETYMNQRKIFGTDITISSITIYPKDFASKQKILNYLDAYNNGKTDSDQIKYTDLAGTIFSSLEMMINIISAVLIAFSAISLVVSSVMIGIITYTSVIERTKEIGILRAIGARKKDVGRLFKAEAALIGFFSGVFGDLIAYILTFLVSFIINNQDFGMDLSHIASLNPWHALILLAVSVALTFISSLIPSRFAANKDPVVALRTE